MTTKTTTTATDPSTTTAATDPSTTTTATDRLLRQQNVIGRIKTVFPADLD
jgi:hypothetical protein